MFFLSTSPPFVLGFLNIFTYVIAKRIANVFPIRVACVQSANSFPYIFFNSSNIDASVKCKQAREQVEKDALVKINTRIAKKVSFVNN